VPYLDRKVVEFMAGLPIGQKVSGRSTKRLFRQVARRHLPEWVLRRPKHGFGSPVAEWLREELRDFAVDVLLAPDAMTGGAAVRRMLDRHQRGAADFNRQLWALLMLELWRKNNR
jgi:asparagine synthase (glutamine-hydrolysing)